MSEFPSLRDAEHVPSVSDDERTILVSTLSTELEVGPMPVSESVTEVKHRLCNLLGLSSSCSVKLMLGDGSELENDRKVLDLPSDGRLVCTIVQNALLLDCGSHMSRIGYVGDDAPAVELPTVVGKLKVPCLDNVGFPYVGKEAERKRGICRLCYVMQAGHIVDWDGMERIWHHIFFNELRVNPQEHPVILTEAPLNPRQNSEKTAQIMYETFGVPSLYVALRPVLCLYHAGGDLTGVVQHIGSDVRYTVPCYEGYALPHGVMRYEKATGGELRQRLVKMLQEHGIALVTTADFEQAQDMLEKHCYVALDFDEECKALGSDQHRTYEMRDGQLITLAEERFHVPEDLFAPYRFYGGKFYRSGLQDDVLSSAMKCDSAIRGLLFSNVVLAGGVANLPGIGARLDKELQRMADMAHSVSVRVLENPTQAAFRGGSKLGSLATFAKCLVKQEDYKEYGPTFFVDKMSEYQ